MPSARPTLTAEDAADLVGERGFGSPRVGNVGVELEWLPIRDDDPTGLVDRQRVRALAEAAGPFPERSGLTFEPGGQLELSTPPMVGIAAACDAMQRDARHLVGALDAHGFGLIGLGLDPRPIPDRVIDEPRYAAMEAYFDSDGTAGRTMMCGTAAIQVNLDLGTPDEVDRRWRVAHSIGPTMAAAFANSPFRDATPTGWRSTRLALWSVIDRARTSPVDGRDRDCRASWARYALGAPVMLVRQSDDRFVPLLRTLSFADWLNEGHELGYPTVDDLDYHLTTLFPPVRPRGWLELRMCDAVPDPWWRAAVAVTTALLDDPQASAEALAATSATAGLWEAAARRGLHDSRLAVSARACFAAARVALDRLDVDRATIEVVDAFIDRYVLAGRCPADDLLVTWSEDGALLPEPDRFVSERRSGASARGPGIPAGSERNHVIAAQPPRAEDAG